MKKLYFIFALTVIAIVLLLIFAFLYFEKEKHQSYFFTVEENSVKTGCVKADYYKTEDYIIYKATSMLPLEISNRIIYEKIVFHKKNFGLINFIQEKKGFRAIGNAVYMKTREGVLDFLAKKGSKFSTMSGIQHARDATVFNERSILSYMPLVDKYDFDLGGAQSFDVIYQGVDFLPPAIGKVVFRSTRDEYITVDSKKIKTEHLVVKGRALPEIRIWVSKGNRKIVQLEIKSMGLTIKKVSLLEKIIAKPSEEKSDLYDSVNVFFSSEDITLSGTLDTPKKGERLPAVLLIVGEGHYNRENAALYTSISHELAKNGYIVLRFDKRGLDLSQGNNASSSSKDGLNDVESALGYLFHHEKVDTNKIFVVTHSEACLYVPMIDLSKYPVSGAIILSAIKPSFLVDFNCAYIADNIKRLHEIDARYLTKVNLLKEETLRTVENAKSAYSTKMGRRIFIQKMKELLSIDPVNIFEEFNAPVIMLHGKKDRLGSFLYIDKLKKILDKNNECSLITFRDLGHFLGNLIKDEKEVAHYDVDTEVLDTIKAGLTVILQKEDKLANENKLSTDDALEKNVL